MGSKVKKKWKEHVEWIHDERLARICMTRRPKRTRPSKRPPMRPKAGFYHTYEAQGWILSSSTELREHNKQGYTP